jgi:hypothetical protein
MHPMLPRGAEAEATQEGGKMTTQGLLFFSMYLWAALTFAVAMRLFAPREGWAFYIMVGAAWPLAAPVWLVVALEQRWAK